MRIQKESFVFSSLIALTGLSSVYAEPLKNDELASTSLNGSDVNTEIVVEKPTDIRHPTACNVFEDPKSVSCIGSNSQVYQPKDRLDSLIIKTAQYAGRFVPLLNNQSDGSTYSNLLINDGKRFIADAGYRSINDFSNKQIQKIPFFAQTTVSISGAADASTSFSIDSFNSSKFNLIFFFGIRTYDLQLLHGFSMVNTNYLSLLPIYYFNS